MVGCGFCWLATSLLNTPSRALVALGLLFTTVPMAFVVWMSHAFPSGRLRSPVSVATVAGGFVVAAVLQAPHYLWSADVDPYDVLTLADRPALLTWGGPRPPSAGSWPPSSATGSRPSCSSGRHRDRRSSVAGREQDRGGDRGPQEQMAGAMHDRGRPRSASGVRPNVSAVTDRAHRPGCMVETSGGQVLAPDAWAGQAFRDDDRGARSVPDELLEVTERQTLTREAAAARLRDLADQLARNNSVEFVRDGVRYTAKVPNQVELKVEIELGDENEIEVEISW